MTPHHDRDLLRALSHRPDGLGERLRGLMSAIYLSRVMESDFAFTWDDELVVDAHHAVSRVEDTFDAAFIERHKLAAFDAGDYAPLPDPVESRAALSSAAGRRGWLLLKNNFPKVLPKSMRLERGAFRDIFDALPFVPRLTRAIRAARAVEIAGPTAALHLRAGDIVYGVYRLSPVNADKVVCAPVADQAIEQLTRDGVTVLLFSQDPALEGRYAGNARVLSAGALAARFTDPTERALFEIVLMSRVDRLFAGASGFARLAAELGDRRPEKVAGLVSVETQLSAIEAHMDSSEALSTLPDLQNAFAAWSGYIAAMELQQVKRALPLILSAIRHDPANGLYRIKLALAWLDAGREDEAERAFRDVLEQTPDTAMIALTGRSRMGAAFMRLEIARLRKAAQTGSAGAQALLDAMAQHQTG